MVLRYIMAAKIHWIDYIKSTVTKMHIGKVSFKYQNQAKTYIATQNRNSVAFEFK